MASLDPDGGLYFETTELEFTSEIITAEGFDAPPEWSWTLTPIGGTPGSSVDGKNIQITPSGETLIAEYFSEAYLFPIRSIEYLKPDLSVHSVKYFEDVPPVEEAPDITALREDKKDFCEWHLDVEASGPVGGMPASAGGLFVIRVYANYSTSRDALVAALDRRYR